MARKRPTGEDALKLLAEIEMPPASSGALAETCWKAGAEARAGSAITTARDMVHADAIGGILAALCGFRHQ